MNLELILSLLTIIASPPNLGDQTETAQAAETWKGRAKTGCSEGKSATMKPLPPTKTPASPAPDRGNQLKQCGMSCVSEVLNCRVEQKTKLVFVGPLRLANIFQTGCLTNSLTTTLLTSIQGGEAKLSPEELRRMEVYIIDKKTGSDSEGWSFCHESDGYPKLIIPDSPHSVSPIDLGLAVEVLPASREVAEVLTQSGHDIDRCVRILGTVWAYVPSGIPVMIQADVGLVGNIIPHNVPIRSGVIAYDVDGTLVANSREQKTTRIETGLSHWECDDYTPAPSIFEFFVSFFH
jgi:hypothetical protein